MTDLMGSLDKLTQKGVLFQPEGTGSAVRCLACAHLCHIPEGRRGICKVRFNKGGSLQVPWGYVAGLHPDPIEKKPFNHVLPGNLALTFGMLGCNFHCEFCQNWLSSQVGRDINSNDSIGYIQKITPQKIITLARRVGAEVIASSYNEPLITTEWATEVFSLAKENAIKTAYVSNGYATREALEMIKPYLTAYKIDLKSMQEHNYRSLGGVLKNVLETIRMVHEMGIWLEIVTLVIPGFNDTNQELWDAARYISSISRDIPWHVTAYHPDYHKQDAPTTPIATLQRAAEIGQEAGLRYVYAGNIPGKAGSLEDTYCPACQKLLIKRVGYSVMENRISAGKCPFCGESIAGIWEI
ncbi:MAG: AmmeMemoRadiSam system radical SAM enzyme [Anaerolineaceae bacterium]|nr:AmmeMemoRadiSam system radical SAM enzyme [Anaerolineaceae bacterium]MBN2677385.1 AmmeMemoRadiSam system radical SAM enzyme [Anaerolineaceae bacterium]